MHVYDLDPVVLRRVERETGHVASAERVLVSTGAKQVLYNLKNPSRMPRRGVNKKSVRARLNDGLRAVFPIRSHTNCSATA